MVLLGILDVCVPPCSPDSGRDPFNQNSDRSDREKWPTSKGGPVFLKLAWFVFIDSVDSYNVVGTERSWSLTPRSLLCCITSDNFQAYFLRGSIQGNSSHGEVIT